MGVKRCFAVSLAMALCIAHAVPAYASVSDYIENVFNRQMVSVDKTIENVSDVVRSNIDSMTIEQTETVEEANYIYQESETKYVSVETFNEELVYLKYGSVEEFLANSNIVYEENIEPIQNNQILIDEAQANYDAAKEAYDAALAEYQAACQIIETTREEEIEVTEEIEDEEGNLITKTWTEIQTITEMAPAGDGASVLAYLNYTSTVLQEAQANLDVAGMVAEPQTETAFVIEKEEPSLEEQNQTVIKQEIVLKEQTTYTSSGTCGDNITWTMDDEGLLTISGTGEMKIQAYNPPWGNTVKRVLIEEGIVNIATGAFMCCTKLTSVEIPSTIISIGISAFESCWSLTDIEIPSNVESIGAAAFYECKELTSIIIPDSVCSIGGSAFANCTNLKSITIPSGVSTIGMEAFLFCTSLDNIVIPETVKSIESGTFYCCSSLTTITIPDSITYIDDSAFAGCGSLSDVYFTGTKRQWDILNYGHNLGFYESVNIHFLDTSDCVSEIKHTLSLEGNIGVNFYFEFTEDALNDNNAVVEFEVDGNRTAYFIKDAETLKIGNVTYHRFTAEVTSVQMASDITARVIMNDVFNVYEEMYSVKEYCDNKINNSSTNTKLKNLLNSLLNYGGYSQINFNVNTEHLANADLEDTDVSDINAETLMSYKSTINGSEDGISLVGSTLILDSLTSIKHYFIVSDEYTIEYFTFYLDGEEISPIENEVLYYIEIPNISSKNLDTMYTVTVGNYNIIYCALSYAYNQLSKTSAKEELKNVCRALYKYNQAANEYFNQQ